MNIAAFCEQCGARLGAGVRFCEACGAAVPLSKPVSPPEAEDGAAVLSEEKTFGPELRRDSGPGTRSVRCPQCGTMSAWSVPQLHEQFAAETLRLDEGLAAGVNASELEQLREQVTPPKPPTTPNVPFWLAVPFLPMVNIVAVWFAPTGRAAKNVLIGLGVLISAGWAYRLHAESVHGAPAEFLSDRYPALGPFSLLDAPLILLFLFLAVYFVAVVLECRRKRQKSDAIEMPRWQEAMDLWKRQRYCEVCRKVFPPSDTSH